MEDLYLKGETGVFCSPDILCNYAAGICEIKGESYLENTTDFYKPVFFWLNNYFNTKKPISFHFRFSYYNTTTGKVIAQMMYELKKYRDQGINVDVFWHYKQNDLEMKLDAEDFEFESGISIKKIPDL